MTYKGPGGHTADGTGPPPHGRGSGPGKGTGTMEIYKKNKKIEDEVNSEPEKTSPLEKKVTGPGGNIPDGTGPPPHGRGSGPGEGSGDILREELQEELYNKYEGRESEVDRLISEYNDKATEYNLTGQDRIDYIRRKVEESMEEGEVDYETGEGDEEETDETEEDGESEEGDEESESEEAA